VDSVHKVLVSSIARRDVRSAIGFSAKNASPTKSEIVKIQRKIIVCVYDVSS
jgi:hypothetical protein